MVAFVIALVEHKKHAEQIKRCIRAGGHDVSVVNCFSMAQTLLQTHPCDLIISEVHLENGGNVFDFLKWVKHDPHLGAIPFVLLSLEPSDLALYLHDGVRMAARHLGAAKYISMGEFDAALFNAALSEFLPQPEDSQSPQLTKETGD